MPKLTRTELEEHLQKLEELHQKDLMALEETMDLLSSVRLGVNLGILRDVEISTVNELFVLTQPAHIQKAEGRAIEGPERDRIRADFVRDSLS